MFDLKKWSDESPIKANVTVAFTLIMAANGLINGILDTYNKIISLSEPDKLLAVIDSANFQNKEFDEIDINFRNPTGIDKSVNNLSLKCSLADGRIYIITAENSTPEKYSTFGSIERTPIKIDKHSSKVVTAVFSKYPQIKRINEKCKSISATWTDFEFKPLLGDETEIPEGAVFFGQR